MPTYDYECPLCNSREELFHGITEDPQATCSACNKGTLKRIIGKGSGIIFKGSGFYATDSKRTNRKAEKVSSSESAPAGKETTTDNTNNTGTSAAKDTSGSNTTSEQSANTKKTQVPA